MSRVVMSALTHPSVYTGMPPAHAECPENALWAVGELSVPSAHAVVPLRSGKTGSGASSGCRKRMRTPNAHVQATLRVAK